MDLARNKHERLALALAKVSCENEEALTRRLRTLQSQLDRILELLEHGDLPSAIREVKKALDSTGLALRRAGGVR